MNSEQSTMSNEQSSPISRFVRWMQDYKIARLQDYKIARLGGSTNATFDDSNSVVLHFAGIAAVTVSNEQSTMNNDLRFRDLCVGCKITRLQDYKDYKIARLQD